MPWEVVPDQTSVITITSYVRYLIVGHNRMTNVSGPTIQFYGQVYNSMVENNQLDNTQQGISIRSLGPYHPGGYLSTFDNEVLNNTLSGVAPYPNTTDSYGISVASLDVDNAISGLVVRGNTVFSPEAIFLSEVWDTNLNNLNSILVEDNQADLSPSTLTVMPSLLSVLFNNNHP